MKKFIVSIACAVLLVACSDEYRSSSSPQSRQEKPLHLQTVHLTKLEEQADSLRLQLEAVEERIAVIKDVENNVSAWIP